MDNGTTAKHYTTHEETLRWTLGAIDESKRNTDCLKSINRNLRDAPLRCLLRSRSKPGTRLWLRPSPLQHIQMTMLSSIRTCHLIPGTRLCLRPSPLQHIQMTIPSSIRTCPLIPGTRLWLRPSPLQHMQMTILSSIPTCHLIPGTRLWLRPSPLQHIQMTIRSSERT